MQSLVLDAAVPVYISNYCDSSCSMCGMNKENKNLIRIEGDRASVIEQLKVLYYTDGIRWVMILSGEYKAGETRNKHIFRVINAVNDAFVIGFQKVTINIGALSDKEIELMKEQFIYPENVVLAVFQETYDRRRYAEEFGTCTAEIPKSDYDNRINTPKRWLEHGFTSINLGILLGVANCFEDVEALISHVEELKENYSCEVYISLPRIVGSHEKCSDNDFISLIMEIKQRIPWVKIIITTRESKDIIGKLIPYIDVISPGTSEVLGYSKSGNISNNPRKSQFVISEIRERPSDILAYFNSNYNIEFQYWEQVCKGEAIV